MFLKQFEAEFNVAENEDGRVSYGVKLAEIQLVNPGGDVNAKDFSRVLGDVTSRELIRQ